MYSIIKVNDHLRNNTDDIIKILEELGMDNITLNERRHEIRCSRDKKFKTGVKIKTVKTFKKKGLTINKLRKKKIWYVQIRAYAAGGGKTYYSPWSAKKSVKVK